MRFSILYVFNLTEATTGPLLSRYTSGSENRCRTYALWTRGPISWKLKWWEAFANWSPTVPARLYFLTLNQIHQASQVTYTHIVHRKIIGTSCMHLGTSVPMHVHWQSWDLEVVEGFSPLDRAVNMCIINLPASGLSHIFSWSPRPCIQFWPHALVDLPHSGWYLPARIVADSGWSHWNHVGIVREGY